MILLTVLRILLVASALVAIIADVPGEDDDGEDEEDRGPEDPETKIKTPDWGIRSLVHKDSKTIQSWFHTVATVLLLVSRALWPRIHQFRHASGNCIKHIAGHPSTLLCQVTIPIFRIRCTAGGTCRQDNSRTVQDCDGKEPTEIIGSKTTEIPKVLHLPGSFSDFFHHGHLVIPRQLIPLLTQRIPV